MSDEERTAAWNSLPEKMQTEIIDLYQSFFITFKTKQVIEDIFLIENIKSHKQYKINESKSTQHR